MKLTAASLEKSARERRSRILREMRPEARRMWREARQHSVALSNAVGAAMLFINNLMRPEVWRGTQSVDRGRAIRKAVDHLDMSRQLFDRYSGFVTRKPKRKP